MNIPDVIKEWLMDFKSNSDEFSLFYEKYFGNVILYSNLINCLKDGLEVKSICHQIYNMGLSNSRKLNILLLDMLPTILAFYLLIETNRNIFNDDSFVLRSCLLSVRIFFNSRLFSNVERLFVFPRLSEGSIYHSPILSLPLDSCNITEDKSNFEKLLIDRDDSQLISELVKIYNYYLNEYSTLSIHNFCALASQISVLTLRPRVVVNTDLLLQLVTVVYSILFKQEHGVIATNALSAIESRANFELMPEIILQVSAIQKSLLKSSTGLINVDIGAHNRSSLIIDSLITNANFRPKKVSEDIEAVTHSHNRNNNFYKTDVEANDVGITFNNHNRFVKHGFDGNHSQVDNL